MLFHVKTDEVASMLKGGNRIPNHLGKLDRTRKLCKQKRESTQLKKALVVVWH